MVQGGSKVSVFANYAVAAGATTSTYHDNIYRPSSASFWADVTELSQDKAMRLAYEISRKAADMIRREAQPHIDAMELLVRMYIEAPNTAGVVDWNFIFDRTMKERATWAKEDASRHAKAWAALLAGGYNPADTVGAPEVPLDSDGPMSIEG